MELVTERTVVRYPTLLDANAYFEMFSDELALRHWFEPAWTSGSQAESRLRENIESNQKGTSIGLCVEDKATGAVVGTMSLHNWYKPSRRAEIGYFVRRTHWGKGLATEVVRALVRYAFDDLSLNRLEADIDPQNAASARVLEKLGFKFEGLMPERWIVNGVTSDTAFYGLLRSDYKRG